MLVAVVGIDTIDGHALNLTISVGAAVYPRDGREAGYRRYNAALAPLA